MEVLKSKPGHEEDYRHPFGRQFDRPNIDRERIMARLEAAELRIAVLEERLRMMEDDGK